MVDDEGIDHRGRVLSLPQRIPLAMWLALVLVSAALGACSPPFPPAGIALLNGQPVVHYKLCAPRVIGELSIRLSDSVRPKWSARLTDASLAKVAIPIIRDVDGYAIISDSEPTLGTNEMYRLAAKDEKGVNIETGFRFRQKELREGMILDRDGHFTRVETWLTDGPRCR